jgi:Polyketide cyclase / dehydrase and lipid transport
MQRTSSPPTDENTIEESAIIRRPVEEVFSFFRDFRNLPHFLGDVMAVEQIGPATFRWTIQGPLGIRVNSTIKVTEERANMLIRYHRCSRTKGVLGNPFRTWISCRRDGDSRSDENTSWEAWAPGTCADWKIPSRRSLFKSAPVKRDNGNRKGNRHELCRGRQVCSMILVAREQELRWRNVT